MTQYVFVIRCVIHCALTCHGRYPQLDFEDESSDDEEESEESEDEEKEAGSDGDQLEDSMEKLNIADEIDESLAVDYVVSS